MVETISSDAGVLCHILRAGPPPDRTVFVTDPDAALQVGHIVHPRGHVIRRHLHVSTERTIRTTAEVLLVRRGRCEIDVYDAAGRLVRTAELQEGDVLVMLAGGHGFRMLEDTVLLEVKQGPYHGAGEKEPF